MVLMRILPRSCARASAGGSAISPKSAAKSQEAGLYLITIAPRCEAQGFSAWPQAQGDCWQPGQPAPYLAASALSRSMLQILANVTSQASTSANSSAVSSLLPQRREADNSPT